MQAIDVSVIIPTYNRLSMLKEALESVFSQDFQGAVEVIVVDDNSQDGTPEFIQQQYPDVHLIRLEQNLGAYGARNRAILISQGQYIAFLDSDDLWQPNYLKTQIDALAGKEKCFCISAVVDWRVAEDQRRILLPNPNLEKYSSPLHHLLAEGSFICTPSAVVFPRQVFTEIGLFDAAYRVSGDNDLYIRCLLQGYQPICTELPTVMRRIHDQGQATNWSNLSIRKQGRLRQIAKYYPLAKTSFDLPSINLIRAELHALYASRYYLRQRNFLDWLDSSLRSVYHAPRYGLSNMKKDIRFYINHYLLRNFQTRVKKKFFNLFKITHHA